jgi:hypothetical protein
MEKIKILYSISKILMDAKETSSESFITGNVRSRALTSLNTPPNLPIGVLKAATMTTSFMGHLLKLD